MSDCSNVAMRELLPDLLHDRLSGGERAEARRHVESCAACGAELELLGRVRDGALAPAIDASRIVPAIAPYRARSFWARAAHAPAVRLAAAVVLVAGSVWAVASRPRTVEVVSLDTVVAVPPAAVVAAAPAAAELEIGEPLADLSEGDLATLIDELDQLDAVTPAEADVELPSIRGSE